MLNYFQVVFSLQFEVSRDGDISSEVFEAKPPGHSQIVDFQVTKAMSLYLIGQ